MIGVEHFKIQKVQLNFRSNSFKSKEREIKRTIQSYFLTKQTFFLPDYAIRPLSITKRKRK